MKYGQIVEWVDKKDGIPYWHTGKVLDIIPAGESLKDRESIKERRILVGKGDISIYDRLLVEVNERHGKQRYHTPRLAKIRAL